MSGDLQIGNKCCKGERREVVNGFAGEVVRERIVTNVHLS